MKSFWNILFFVFFGKILNFFCFFWASRSPHFWPKYVVWRKVIFWKPDPLKCFLWPRVKEGIGRRGVEIVSHFCQSLFDMDMEGGKKWSGEICRNSIWPERVPVQKKEESSSTKKEESPRTKRTFLFITASALQTFIYEGRSVRTLCIYHTFYSVLVDQLYFCKAIPFETDPHPPGFTYLWFFSCWWHRAILKIEHGFFWVGYAQMHKVPVLNNIWP